MSHLTKFATSRFAVQKCLAALMVVYLLLNHVEWSTPQTSRDPINTWKLTLDCPPLDAEPWRGFEIPSRGWKSPTPHPDFMLGDGELLWQGGGNWKATFNAVERDLWAPPIPRLDFGPTGYGEHEADYANEAFFTTKASDEDDEVLIRVTKSPLQIDGRWQLPTRRVNEFGQVIRSNWTYIVGRTADGRLALVSNSKGKTDWLYFLDTTTPSPTTPPTELIAATSKIDEVKTAWRIGPTSFLLLAGDFNHYQRMLVEWTTGQVTIIADDDLRYLRYGTEPPFIGFSGWPAEFQNPKVRTPHLIDVTTTGTCAVRLGMPRLSPDNGDEYFGPPFVAGSVGRTSTEFALHEHTNRLALYAASKLEDNPFQLQALNETSVMVLQVVPPVWTSRDARLKRGAIRIGKLTPEMQLETWVGTVPLPEGAAIVADRIKCARIGNHLYIAVLKAAHSKPPRRQWFTFYPELYYWTRLPWPEAFPADVPDGWLDTTTPRPDSSIPERP